MNPFRKTGEETNSGPSPPQPTRWYRVHAGGHTSDRQMTPSYADKLKRSGDFHVVPIEPEDVWYVDGRHL